MIFMVDYKYKGYALFCIPFMFIVCFYCFANIANEWIR